VTSLYRKCQSVDWLVGGDLTALLTQIRSYHASHIVWLNMVMPCKMHTTVMQF